MFRKEVEKRLHGLDDRFGLVVGFTTAVEARPEMMADPDGLPDAGNGRL
jgi:hypothetical protein